MLHQQPRQHAVESSLVQIDAGGTRLEGQLAVPPSAMGVVVFANGSGGSRHSPQNKLVARVLREQARAGTLLVDLLDSREEDLDHRTGELRFDIPFLVERLSAVCDWARRDLRTRALPLGILATGTGAAAALIAAADEPDQIAAVVSRAGRPDLAGPGWLAEVLAPTLLIVGSEDSVVLDLNRATKRAMVSTTCKLEIVLGASHSFSEPGTLDEAARLAAAWFARYLRRPTIARVAP